MEIHRRQLISLFGAAACTSLFARAAQATLVRGLTLPALAGRSDRIVVARALAAETHYVELGGIRRIVTDVTVDVEQVLAKAEPAPRLSVRVLGGVVGREGEYVVGQPELELDRACVLFLRATPSGPHWVNGMAQGHFPLRADASGTRRLCASPRLPDMLDREHSAVHALHALDVATARSRILEALAP